MADPWLEQYAGGEPYRRFLHRLIVELRPQAVLELGTYICETSAFMASAAALVGAISIGIDQRGEPDLAKELKRRFGYHFLFCDTLGAAPLVRNILSGKKLGIVFQDSSHHAEPSRLEWEYYKPMLADNFIWVCDDITPAFRMRDEPLSMVQYFNRLPGTKIQLPGLHIGNVIGVVTP